MHDLKAIRQKSDFYKEAFEKRGVDKIVDNILALDQQNRELVTLSQKLQQDRNILSKAIGALMSQGKKKMQNAKQKVGQIKQDMTDIEVKQGSIAEELHGILSSHPNILDADVPVGADEEDNVEIRKFGEPKEFSFEAKEHDVLGSRNNAMDFETAANISGSRFVFLKDELCLLERALATFMIDTHATEFGYTEVSPPALVWDKALFGTGQLPKFKEDLFVTTGEHSLIPTAEVSLTNYVREQILSEEELPLRFTAWTQCLDRRICRA